MQRSNGKVENLGYDNSSENIRKTVSRILGVYIYLGQPQDFFVWRILNLFIS